MNAVERKGAQELRPSELCLCLTLGLDEGQKAVQSVLVKVLDNILTSPLCRVCYALFIARLIALRKATLKSRNLFVGQSIAMRFEYARAVL